ncbi:MAG: hypothetical protein E6H05_11010 [Bacillati bacterium ANGP1]|uniref:DUF2281 domain-containing protein n=1 Tax=Candidatus Segetimicrobium genomatis TaxID=2569760 RepID=A0A537IMJ2_9BACT|nr:MAG: hypothetical protein E6H05_11010 [Terrabacteria group bacterium ANGP1]
MSVTQQLQRLRGTTPETLEALLGYIEYLAAREAPRHPAQGDATNHTVQDHGLGPAAWKIATTTAPATGRRQG